jgi:ADP-ribose pyrophosphatase
MEAYKTIKSEKVFKGKILDVLHDTIKLPNGKEATMEIVTHGGAAAVVPIDKEGCIILVRQYRHAIGAMTLEIPAGKIDKGENPYTCALRELEEETGYIGKNCNLLIKMYTAIGFCQEAIYIYLAECEQTGVINLDEDEFVTLEKYKLEDAYKMILSGDIVDGKTITGILMTREALKNKSVV